MDSRQLSDASQQSAPPARPGTSTQDALRMLDTLEGTMGASMLHLHGIGRALEASTNCASIHPANPRDVAKLITITKHFQVDDSIQEMCDEEDTAAASAQSPAPEDDTLRRRQHDWTEALSFVCGDKCEHPAPDDAPVLSETTSVASRALSLWMSKTLRERLETANEIGAVKTAQLVNAMMWEVNDDVLMLMLYCPHFTGPMAPLSPLHDLTLRLNEQLRQCFLTIPRSLIRLAIKSHGRDTLPPEFTAPVCAAMIRGTLDFLHVLSTAVVIDVEALGAEAAEIAKVEAELTAQWTAEFKAREARRSAKRAKRKADMEKQQCRIDKFLKDPAPCALQKATSVLFGDVANNGRGAPEMAEACCPLPYEAAASTNPAPEGPCTEQEMCSVMHGRIAANARAEAITRVLPKDSMHFLAAETMRRVVIDAKRFVGICISAVHRQLGNDSTLTRMDAANRSSMLEFSQLVTDAAVAIDRLTAMFARWRRSGVDCGVSYPAFRGIPKAVVDQFKGCGEYIGTTLDTVSLEDYLAANGLKKEPAPRPSDIVVGNSDVSDTASRPSDRTLPTSEPGSDVSSALTASGSDAYQCPNDGFVEGALTDDEDTAPHGASPPQPLSHSGKSFAGRSSSGTTSDEDDGEWFIDLTEDGPSTAMSNPSTLSSNFTDLSSTTAGARAQEAQDRNKDRFAISRDHVLGRGAFGTVFRGFDNDRGTPVAVKEVQLEAADTGAAASTTAERGSPNRGSGGIGLGIGTAAANAAAATASVVRPQMQEMTRQVTAEFRLLQRIDCPEIVKVVAASLDLRRGRGRLVLEWMPGGSLASILKQTGRPFRDVAVRRYIRQLLRAVSYLHSRHLVHRDIKPANLLLTAAGDVKLSDFGTSREGGFLTGSQVLPDGQVVLGANDAGHSSASRGSFRTGTVVGTVPYLAPEAFSGRYSKATDVWAVGCTALELMTGSMPWSERGITDHIALIFAIGSAVPPNHHPRLPGTVDSVGKDFFLRCFEKEAADRATADELLAHPWLQTQ